MNRMSWFKRDKKPIHTPSDEKRTIKTEGLFTKCGDCNNIIWKKDLDSSLFVCPKCSFHFKINARQRLEMLMDGGKYEEFEAELKSTDPLGFVDRKKYDDRLRAAVKASGCNEAVVNGEGSLMGVEIICSAMEYSFIGGSMGSVVGEKITIAVERARERRKPLIIVSASGGARMMESFLSLMQMAKISAALAHLHEAKIPFISILTDPTTGGVTASYAMLGDLNIAEPKALIGFAGPRVIEQTIRQKLPEGFQRSEFLLDHGMLDAIVHRKDQREFIHDWFRFMGVT